MRISDWSSDVCSSDLLLHARDLVDAELDLLRIDVEAAGDDEVLGPPDDMDVAALVDRRHVSGDEEAVLAELGGGLLRLAPRSEERRVGKEGVSPCGSRWCQYL